MIEQWRGKGGDKSAEQGYLINPGEVARRVEDKNDAEGLAKDPVQQLKKFRDNDIDQIRAFGAPFEETVGVWATRDVRQLIATIKEFRIPVDNELLQTVIDGPQFAEESDKSLFVLLKQAGYSEAELQVAVTADGEIVEERLRRLASVYENE
jgi:hypothetical protein